MKAETPYKMIFFTAMISFIEEYGYVLKDEVRVQQNSKLRDFLKAADDLTYRFQKDLPPSAEKLNDEVIDNMYIFEEEFITAVRAAIIDKGEN